MRSATALIDSAGVELRIAHRCTRCGTGSILPDLAGGRACVQCGYEPPSFEDLPPAERPKGKSSKWD